MLRIIALQSNVYDKFSLKSNFEDMNKFTHGKPYGLRTARTAKHSQTLEQRLKIKNFGSVTSL